jgi:hypothetical protein
LHQNVYRLSRRTRYCFHQRVPRTTVNILSKNLPTTAHQPGTKLLRGHAMRIGDAHNPGTQRFTAEHRSHNRQSAPPQALSVDLCRPKLLLLVHGKSQRS